MNIAYFASPEIAVDTLKALIKDPEINVKLIVTQSDKRSGRGFKMNFSPIKELAINEGIPLLQPEKSSEIFETLKNYDLDLNLVFAFGMILKSNTLNHPKYSSINIHASILPKYRGASPITEAILNGDRETGISIMKMDEELDHGNILKIFKTQIEETETASEISKKISDLSSQNIVQTLKDYIEGKLKDKPQDHKNATFCRKHNENDAKLNFNEIDSKVLNKIRAFDSNPKAFFLMENGQKIIVHKGEKTEEILKPGEFKTENKELLVGTAKNAIKILELTLQGKKRMNAMDFLNGYKQLFR